MKKMIFSDMKSCQSQVPSGTLQEVLQEVREQVELDCISTQSQRQAEELCLIIAEVYKLPKQTPVRIGGQQLPAEMVQEVYLMLAAEHIEQVISNFGQAEYPIRFKKTYLRTALYNVAFEYESGIANGFHISFPGLGKITR